MTEEKMTEEKMTEEKITEEKDENFSLLCVKQENLDLDMADDDTISAVSGGNSEKSFLEQFSIAFLPEANEQNNLKNNDEDQQLLIVKTENKCDNENIADNGRDSIKCRNRRQRNEGETEKMFNLNKRQCRGRNKFNVFSNESSIELFNSDDLLNDSLFSKSNKLLFWSGLFYKIVETNDRKKGSKNIVAACLKCNVRIRGSLRVSSNFLSHLKSKHPEKLKEFVERKTSDRKKLPREKSLPKPLQSNFPQKILNFLSSGYYPLATVENKQFIDLFSNTEFVIPTESYIDNLLKTECDTFTQSIKKHLCSAKYVCTSVDTFILKSNFYIAYGCYWIGTDYKRKNVLLACKKLYGSIINKEIIDAYITEVNKKFELNDSKILCTTVNNVVSAINVVKNLGFQKFKTAMKNPIENATIATIEKTECEKVNSVQTVGSGKIAFHNVDVDVDFSTAKCLPCVVSSLDMTEKMQLIDVIKNRYPEFYCQHILVMHRIINFWEFCRSSQLINHIKDSFSDISLNPELSCWNSVYKSIKDIYNMQNALINFKNELQLGVFEEQELLYIMDYLKILQPISDAYEFLLNIDNLFFGNFLPALITIEVKLRKLLESNSLVILQNLCKDIHDFLIVQFEEFFQVKETSYDAIVAAACMPSVKQSFLKNLTEFSDDHLVQVLCCYAREFYNENQKENKINQHVEQTKQTENFDESSESGDEFYDFGHDKILQTKTKSKDFPIKREILAYLADDTTKSYELLNKYPLIRSLFFKYNTCLPMNSFAERSLASIGIIEDRDAPAVTDVNFERMIFYRHYTQNVL